MPARMTSARKTYAMRFIDTPFLCVLPPSGNEDSIDVIKSKVRTSSRGLCAHEETANRTIQVCRFSRNVGCQLSRQVRVPAGCELLRVSRDGGQGVPQS